MRTDSRELRDGSRWSAWMRAGRAALHNLLHLGLGLLLSAPLLAHPANLHVSERVAFLHFIDTVSAWSPYCPANAVDYGLLGVPRFDAEAKAWLSRYATARKPLGYSAETALFLWAEQDFPLAGKPEEYRALKACVEYFLTRPEYREPLARRMIELVRLVPSVQGELALLDTKMKPLQGVTGAFTQGGLEWREVPIFLVYTFSKHSVQGGANGEGIYAEVDPAASLEGLREQCGIFLHEALHKALKPREAFLAFAGETEARKGWRVALKTRAPGEGGDEEAAMLDEILVYTLADVILRGREPEKEIQNYSRQGNRQFVRLWDGVRILKPIVQAQLDKPKSRELFLTELIEAFMAKVQTSVWQAPNLPVQPPVGEPRR